MTTMKSKDMQPEVYAQQIMKIYDLATQDEINDGMLWYKRAYAFCETLAENFDTTVRHAAGVVAALSPACKWEQNLIDAVSIFIDGADAVVTSYSLNKDKAFRIAHWHEDPEEVLGGDKVTSFYHNILAYDRAGHVTIDRHAVKAAVPHGSNLTANEASYYANTPTKYAKMSEAYRIAAKKLNILPHQLQAIVWVTWRRLNSEE